MAHLNSVQNLRFKSANQRLDDEKKIKINIEKILNQIYVANKISLSPKPKSLKISKSLNALPKKSYEKKL